MRNDQIGASLGQSIIETGQERIDIAVSNMDMQGNDRTSYGLHINIPLERELD